MNFHEVKTHAPYLDAIVGKAKTAEWRIDDRDPRYEVGDVLVHRRMVRVVPPSSLPTWERDESATPVLTEITHIVRGPDFGIPDGYAVLSIRLVHLELAAPHSPTEVKP